MTGDNNILIKQLRKYHMKMDKCYDASCEMGTVNNQADFLMGLPSTHVHLQVVAAQLLGIPFRLLSPSYTKRLDTLLVLTGYVCTMLDKSRLAGGIGALDSPRCSDSFLVGSVPPRCSGGSSSYVYTPQHHHLDAVHVRTSCREQIWTTKQPKHQRQHPFCHSLGS